MISNIDFKIIDKHIGCLTLSRSPFNALSSDFLLQIQNIIKDISKNLDCRVLIIKSSLDNFSVGADLKERKIMSKLESHKALDIFNNCFNSIENLNIPTICLVNGFCLGGGTELALSCDIRVVSYESQIGLPETSIGIIPGAGGTFRLPRVIGVQNAKYWIFTAKKFTGKETINYGFAINCVKFSNLFDEGMSIAKDILKNAPIAVKSAKKAINMSLFETNRDQCLKAERNNYKITLKSKDRDEALDAFLNKRKPNWNNE
ncbi:MAG: enoyl-CoA hydratase [Candidatus Marinimicrobia bacterium]|nr:enoyl-CoA hydratase [Candidatus Neomarinimicrobiota bacterium]